MEMTSDSANDNNNRTKVCHFMLNMVEDYLTNFHLDIDEFINTVL